MSRLMTMEEWREVRLFKIQNPEPLFPEPIPPRSFYDGLLDFTEDLDALGDAIKPKGYRSIKLMIWPKEEK